MTNDVKNPPQAKGCGDSGNTASQDDKIRLALERIRHPVYRLGWPSFWHREAFKSVFWTSIYTGQAWRA